MELGGIILPLITPFTDDNRVDAEGLKLLVEHYIAQGIGGLIVCDTTGEAASLGHDEYLVIVRTVVESARQRVPVLAGTGSSDTAKTIALTREAERLGADAALIVTPFYSNPGNEGLFLHFQTIARATNLRILIYNVPHTGVNLDPQLVLRLSEMTDNICGVVDRARDLELILNLLGQVRDGFWLIGGQQQMVLPAACLGVQGMCIPAAHTRTSDFVRLFDLAQKGQLEEARRLNQELLELINVLLSEPNPAPIKAALQILRLPGGAPRLPVAPASVRCRTELRRILSE